jgi:hypothetical protein
VRLVDVERVNWNQTVASEVNGLQDLEQAANTTAILSLIRKTIEYILLDFSQPKKRIVPTGTVYRFPREYLTTKLLGPHVYRLQNKINYFGSSRPNNIIK